MSRKLPPCDHDECPPTRPGILDAFAGSHAPCPERFEMGDKRRFHWRRCDQWINGVSQEQYEVYSIGLETWAMCYLPTEAAAVADGLELLYANDQGEAQPCSALAGTFDIEAIEQAFFNHDHDGSEPAPGEWEKRRDQWRSLKAYLAAHPRQETSGRDAYKDEMPND